jgi:hypothetical protein
MKEIVRLYLYPDGKEVCIKDPEEMIKLLSGPTEDIDLDYHDARGFAKVSTSQELIGETVRVGEVEIEIPNH